MFIAVLFAFFSDASYATSPFVQSVARQEIILHGQKAYLNRCAGCHGENGNGQGPASLFLNPKPRDFTAKIFKFRSGPLGTLPSDQDLMNVLSKGIYGTSMPSFADVPEQERFAIVQYIKTFSKAWEEPGVEITVVQGSPFPEADFKSKTSFLGRAKKGRALFIESCVLCHGLTGLGDGEGAADLEDEWGQKIRPADFSRVSIKSGKSVKDIYKTLLVGVNGTPMSSYKDIYTDDQLWDLTAWVLYLRGVHNETYDTQKLPLPMIKADEIQ